METEYNEALIETTHKFRQIVKKMFIKNKLLRMTVNLDTIFDKNHFGARLYFKDFVNNINKNFYHEVKKGEDGVTFYAKDFLSEEEMSKLPKFKLI